MQKRIENLIQRVGDDFEAAIITSAENRFYLLGLKSSAGTAIILKDKTYFIIDFRYIQLAQKTIKGAEIILQGKLYDQINEILKSNNIKNVWIEDSTTVGQLNVYKKNFCDYNIVTDSPLSAIINDLRAVKDDAEIDAIKKAQKITDDAFAYICTQIAPGKKERDLAIDLENFMKKQGADDIAFSTILVSGKNSSLPHGVPGEKLIEAGDFVTIDFGAKFSGYCTDMTRTVAVGYASDEMKEVYNTVLQAQLKAIDTIKAGVVCEAVDKIARDYINEKYEGRFGHGLGHSLGIMIHESPRFGVGEAAVLKEGMVLTVEPGVYLDEKFGVRIEDTICVTTNGLVNFAKSPKELIIL